MKGNKMRCALGLVMSAWIGAGCAGTPITVNESYDFSKVDRIAILGFEPYQGAPASGSGMATVFEKYFMRAGYRLVERQNVEKVLKEQNFELSGSVDPQQAKQLGKILGVDALILGSVTVYTPEKRSVVMVDVDSYDREPVIASRTMDVIRDGEHRKETVNVVVDYRVTHRVESVPQVYRLAAETGVVVKMVDARSGEIAWVGTDTEEGNNVQVANEMVAERIVRALKKYWPTKKP